MIADFNALSYVAMLYNRTVNNLRTFGSNEMFRYNACADFRWLTIIRQNRSVDKAQCTVDFRGLTDADAVDFSASDDDCRIIDYCFPSLHITLSINYLR